ncbi:hypothetical protein Plhal304r1_c068g0155911 [Plasmopara halstedii]
MHRFSSIYTPSVVNSQYMHNYWLPSHVPYSYLGAVTPCPSRVTPPPCYQGTYNPVTTPL